MGSENIRSLIDLATSDLDLLSPQGRVAFVSQCQHKSLKVDCIDRSVDICPQGHLLYGISTIACVALPGILFAMSDFIYYKGFSFGRLFGGPYFRSWPLLIKLILLPAYVVFMIPFIIVITVVQ